MKQPLPDNKIMRPRREYRPERIEWPDGARVAVTMTFALELWDKARVEPGYHDGSTVNVSPELLAAGYVDPGALSWQNYGPRRGMPRLLAIANRQSVPVTAVVSGLAAQEYPALMRAFAAAGHEVAAHSWTQEIRAWALSSQEERANIERCRDAIETATGAAPCGWIGPSAQPSWITADLLQQAGYTWHGDYCDDDFPYFLQAGDGRIVAIPYQFDLNDLKVYIGGKNDPEVYVNWFRNKFDTIYRESAQSGGMVSATVHAALYGRPFGSWAVEACISYARQFDDVWFATRADIAEWMESRYGAQCPF